MNLGAFVYQLRANQDGRISMTHGRFMHAAIFAALHKASPELAKRVHDSVQIKPFTVDSLQFQQARIDKKTGMYIVKKADLARWRMTTLDDEVLAALLSLPVGYLVQVGQIEFYLEKIIVNQSEVVDTGIIGIENFIAECMSVGQVKSMTFDFITPVSFRSFDSDYPFPLPDFIWGSLCERWNRLGMQPQFDEKEIRQVATTLLPLAWQGETKKLYFAKNRSVLGFVGSFSYDLTKLDEEIQRVFFILAQFAFFAGVGRLTGQGLGQTRVSYK